MPIRRSFLPLLVAAFALLLWAGSAKAMTLQDITELCRAGYSTDEIVEIIGTLGLDETIDSEALIYLSDEGCNSDLGIILLREFGDEYGNSDDSYYEPQTNVYIYDDWGWNSPYHRSWNWSIGWHSPWWGVNYSYYDPWYRDWWYSPGYHWSGWYHDWNYWRPYHYNHHHDYYHGHRYANYTSKSERYRSRSHSSSVGYKKSYRASVSDARVKRATSDRAATRSLRATAKTRTTRLQNQPILGRKRVDQRPVLVR